MSKNEWPAWRYGPGGESKIFEKASEVPAGWQDHPTKHAAAKAPKTEAPKTETPGKTPAPAKTEAPGTVEIDAHGWPWSADLHSATQSKTSAGLWRMKVGAKRPDAKPGYPLDL